MPDSSEPNRLKFPADVPFVGSLKFLEAGNFCKLFRHLENRVGSPWLKPIAASFAINMERIVSLHTLPLEILYWERGFRDAATREEWAHRAGALTEDDQENAQELMRELMTPKFGVPKDQWVSTLTERGNNIELYHFFERAWSVIKDADHSDVKTLTEGIDSLFSMMLISAYAAFEALASDSWVEAVNRIKTFRTRAIEAQGRDRSIKWSNILSYEENFSQSVGTILRLNNCVHFDSLHNIRNAFRWLFTERSEDVFARHKNVIKAEKVRHLIAHRSGIVDRKFQDETSDFPDVCGIPIGERLPIDAILTRDLIESCVRTAIELVLLIDERPPNEA